jgi:hypothetical protein
MANEDDRILLYKNEQFTRLTILVGERGALLDELEALNADGDKHKLENAMKRYERLSSELMKIGYKLAEHGVALDKSLR